MDESISRWYGQGGSWIDHGLPMYVAIDRKPENGCGIQNSACGRSGIMLRLQLVTTADDEAERTTAEERNLLHGTAVLCRLVEPWAGSSRTVCADSYFASVEAAVTLASMGMRFIGVVKAATRNFPMAELARRPACERGDRACMVHKGIDGKVDMMALMWVDRERRYFISTTSSAADGTPYERIRWRQTGSFAQRVLLTVRQPKVVETYYSSCAAIDRHNRCRQDDLQLERKLVTLDWSKRVGISLLGIIIVDSWLLYSGAHGGEGLTQRKFYEVLSSQLIDNFYNYIGLRPRAELLSDDAVASPALSAFGPRLSPTKKRKRNNFAAQRDCQVCKNRSTLVCSTCREISGTEVFLCSSKKGRACFLHLQKQEQGISA